MDPLRIVSAVGLGALLGFVSGVNGADYIGLGSGFAALVGTVVGALVGWLTYDIRAVGRALARAGHEVGQGIVSLVIAFVMALPAIAAAIATFAIMVAINALCWNAIDEWWSSKSWFHVGLGTPAMDFWWYVKMIVATIVLAAAICAIDDDDGRGPQVFPELEHRFGAWAIALALILIANPAFVLAAVALLIIAAVCIIVLLAVEILREAVKGIGRGIHMGYRAVVALPWFVMTCGRVVRRAFIYLHSDARMLCFLNGGLGGGVGAYFGNASVGIAAGVVSALAQYALARYIESRKVRID